MKNILIAVLLLAASATAQESFWKANRVLIAADVAAKAADAYYTHSMLDGVTLHNGIGPNGAYITWYRHGYEDNPIARPFVTRGTAGQVGFFSAALAGDVLSAYLLHKHGHTKLEKIVLTFGIGYSVEGAVQSAHAYYSF